MLKEDMYKILKIKNMTPTQKEVVTKENTPIIVSASAGSGKTFCLTSRFLLKILRKNNRISPEELLVITFSKNAANEMYSRIIEKIEDIFKKNPNNIEIKKIKDNISKTNITTIDSFCHNILKQNYILANISPNFKIISEFEIKQIKNEVLNSIFMKKFKKNPKDFQSLCNYFSLKSNDELKEIIFKIYNKAKTEAFPKLYIEKITSNYNNPPNIDKSEYIKEIKSNLIYKIQKAKSMLKSAINLLNDNITKKNFEPTIKKIIINLEVIEKKIFSLKINSLKNLLNNIKLENFPRYNAKTNPFDKILAEKLKTKYINPAKKIINSLKKYIISEEEYINHFKIQKPIIKDICKILFEFIKKLEKEKRKNNILEFSDLISKTLQLMANTSNKGKILVSEFGKNMSSKFEEIMVDEFQDINNSQNMLINILSNNNKKLFAVGDIKQNIYGFRHAEIENFLNLQKKYSKKNNNLNLIYLNNNFRSKKEITNSVNFLFGQIMTKKFGKIDYKNKNKLICNQDSKKNEKFLTELNILENKDKKMTDEEIEIYYIVNKIKKMLYNKFEVEENGIKRPCEPKDFAILLRSGKKELGLICEKLEKLNIDFNSDENTNFLKSYEISIVISLLKIISNPLLDISFCAVLISPMFEFTEQELIEIKFKNNHMPFFLAFKKTNNIKCKTFLNILNKLIKKAQNLGLKDLILEIYNKLVFTKIFNYIKFNKIKEKNLELFLYLAANYKNYKKYGLTGFLKYIETIKDDEIDIKTKTSKTNSVTVTTIHKSKGLEFPIVFVALTNKQFNDNDFTKPFLISTKFGLTLKHSSKETLYIQNTIPFLAASFFEKKKTKEQELRLLYVAMTRAKEKLILTAVDNKNIFEKFKNQNFKNSALPPEYLIDKKSLYEWVLSGLIRHKNYSNKHNILDYRTKEFYCQPIIKKETLIISNNDSENKPELFIDQKTINKIKNQINFKYIKNTKKIPSKISVTDLIRKKEKTLNYKLEIPSLEENPSPTPSETGSALHTFLQFADFEMSEKNIEIEIKRLMEKEFITKKQANILNLEQIKNFFYSKAYNIIKNADKIYREKNFICEVDIKKIFKNKKSCNMLIQGVIDCLIEKNGKMTIIDYKTDKLDEKNLIKQYKSQIKCYKYAIEKITKKPVICCLIYSTHLNKSIKI